jgi:antirestriction protein ArdC
MAKAKVDVYQMVTDRFIEALERGTPPWVCPYNKGTASGLPYNMTSMKPEEGQSYTGINVPLLWAAGYNDARWITMNQAKKKGIRIIESEAKNWSPIVFWNFFEKEQADGSVRKIPFLRYYRVYNAEQCEPDTLPATEQCSADPTVGYERCSSIVDKYGVKVLHGQEDPWYKVHTDLVGMPDPERFKSEDHYWAACLHEMVHSTGHKRRLDRDNFGKGKASYAFEEMIAEMGSAFLCARLGIDRPEITQNHESFVAAWLDVLHDDKRAVYRAAKAAQLATNLLMEHDAA